MNSDDQNLTLGLGFPSSSSKPIQGLKGNLQTLPSVLGHEPSLTLSLSGETFQKKAVAPEDPPCSVSAASSLSNVVVSVKRERESASSEDLDTTDKGYSRVSDEEEEEGSGPTAATTRKKLRLTKEQSALLEDSFKQQSTLNPQKQKQALADRLNLRPRQVEVWFQNRRARTKLKQTEVDCEYLRKCCETLTDENRRLQKELQELKALKLAQPFYMHLPAATLTMCPSCERIGAGVPTIHGTATTASKSAFSMGPKSHFYASAPNRPLLVDN